ncbi:hypothetical protein [Nocardioides sp. BYT-33-1]|uniref:hypothetical protein n=1 Tax=Nocardioides sp. BYT-33-1 TaxID=3416952 RepID=UPI003F535726
MSAQIISMPEPDPKPNIKVEIILVTPDLAEAWLGKNTKNRNLVRKNITKFARDMKAGAWRMNGEAIKFASDGTLLDGQNRLHAVIASGASVWMMVIRELSADVMPTLDTGKSRSFANVLQIDGEGNTSSLAALVRRALMWDAGQRTNAGQLSPTINEMQEFLEDNPEIRTSAEVARKLQSRSLLPGSVLGLSHWLFSAIDPDAATWFVARVVDEDVPTGHPARVLHRRIVAMRLAGGRINETEALALTIRAWNAYRRGETPRKFQMPKGGLTNDNFPEPQ